MFHLLRLIWSVATVTRDKVDFCYYAYEDSDDTQLTDEI